MQLPLASGYHVNREAQLQPSSPSRNSHQRSWSTWYHEAEWEQEAPPWGVSKMEYKVWCNAHHSGWWFYCGGNPAQGSKFRCKSQPQEPVPKESWESSPTTLRVRWATLRSRWSAQTLTALITALAVSLKFAGCQHMHESLHCQHQNPGVWSCIHSSSISCQALCATSALVLLFHLK